VTDAPVVLCLNAGSSSLKFSVYRDGDRGLAEGAVEEIGREGARAWIKRTGGAPEQAGLLAHLVAGGMRVCAFAEIQEDLQASYLRTVREEGRRA